MSEDEKVVIVEETQHVPADVSAIRFYLTNRAPARWQNRVELEGAVHAESFEDYLARREKEDGEGDY